MISRGEPPSSSDRIAVQPGDAVAPMRWLLELAAGPVMLS
jgi:hypothetical protein